MGDDVIFKGENADVSEWEDVDSGAPDSDQDYNDYDLEFIDMDDVEEGDYWIGEYTGTRVIGDAQNASAIFDNDDKEVSYAFTPHAMMKTQLADTELSDNQTRADDPVEVGETVAVVYKGTQDLDNRPMPMHVWKLKRPPE